MDIRENSKDYDPGLLPSKWKFPKEPPTVGRVVAVCSLKRPPVARHNTLQPQMVFLAQQRGTKGEQD
jgi:hypothetical protein